MTVEGIEQLKRWLKWYAALAAVPFCFGLLTVWLPFFLSLLMLVGIAGLYLIGIAVTVRSSMSAWQTRPLGSSPMRRVGATLIPSLLLALAISTFFRSGRWAGASVTLRRLPSIMSGLRKSSPRKRSPHPPMVEASSGECPTGPIPDRPCVLPSFQRGCSITGPH